MIGPGLGPVAPGSPFKKYVITLDASELQALDVGVTEYTRVVIPAAEVPRRPIAHLWAHVDENIQFLSPNPEDPPHSYQFYMSFGDSGSIFDQMNITSDLLGFNYYHDTLTLGQAMTITPGIPLVADQCLYVVSSGGDMRDVTQGRFAFELWFL